MAETTAEDVLITIRIPEKLHGDIQAHLAPMMKPPRRDPISGVIVTEPMFNAADPVAEWVQQTVAINIQEILRSLQSPPAQMVALEQAVEDAHAQLRDFCTPTVSSSRITNSTVLREGETVK